MVFRFGAAVLGTMAAMIATPAAANCKWEWLCNGEGACKQLPVCDNVYEVPPPAPDAKPPAMPPLALRPSKMPVAMSSLTCEHIMRQGKSGRWYWDQACFCTDKSKARDPSSPFANIVRCDDK